MAFKTVLTFNCIAGNGFVGFPLYSIRKLNEVAGISDAFFLAPSNPPRRCELKRATGRALEPPARARLRSNKPTPISNSSHFPYPFYPRIVLQTLLTLPSDIESHCVASQWESFCREIGRA